MASPSSPAGRTATDDLLVSSLIALMERGTTPWRREWDGRSGGHHVNVFSGRAYQGANPILLTIGLHQRSATLPFWCGAAEARGHGLLPKPGSRMVTVLRPQLKRRPCPAPQAAPAAPGRSPQAQAPPAIKGRGRAWVRYRPVSLFNVEDLEGDGLAGLIEARQAIQQASRRAEPERLARAEGVLRRWAVPMRHAGDRAFYNPQRDQIQLPERRAFHSSAALYATWAHEALHSTGHPSRLGRDLSGAMGGRAYAREELVAELGAVLLGDRLEIGSDMSNHAAYLAEWVSLLRETPQVLYKVLSEARRAADLICPPSAVPEGQGGGSLRIRPPRREGGNGGGRRAGG